MEIKNWKELTQHLLNTIDELKRGKIDYKIAVEMDNAAGKVISLSKLRMEYGIARKKIKEMAQIEFLEDDKQA